MSHFAASDANSIEYLFVFCVEFVIMIIIIVIIKMGKQSVQRSKKLGKGNRGEGRT